MVWVGSSSSSFPSPAWVTLTLDNQCAPWKLFTVCIIHWFYQPSSVFVYMGVRALGCVLLGVFPDHLCTVLVLWGWSWGAPKPILTIPHTPGLIMAPPGLPPPCMSMTSKSFQLNIHLSPFDICDFSEPQTRSFCRKSEQNNYNLRACGSLSWWVLLSVELFRFKSVP